MALNVTTAVFAENCNTATASPSLAQWDTEQVLQISGIELPDSYKVEFSTVYTRNAIPEIGDASGVTIPNVLLQRSAPITAYIVLYGENGGRNREYWITIYITPGQPPETITPDPEQADVIDEAIAALNNGVARTEAAAGEAEAAAEAIQDMDVEAETLAEGAAASVEKTVDPETGAVTLRFGIPKGTTGNPGTPGQDGTTPDFRIGTVETLNPGQSATATITGTPAQPVLNLGIPQGQKGDPGGDSGTSDYTELENKPQINGHTLSGNQSAADLGLGTYSKPASGIPKTDLAQDVQASLGKADSALQTAPVQSVAGKTGAVTLGAGDVGYSESETYQSGTVGYEVSELSRHLSDLDSDKQDAPSTAGTAGQVLGLDSNLNPAWMDQTGGGGSGDLIYSYAAADNYDRYIPLEIDYDNNRIRLDHVDGLPTSFQAWTIDAVHISPDVITKNLKLNQLPLKNLSITGYSIRVVDGDWVELATDTNNIITIPETCTIGNWSIWYKTRSNPDIVTGSCNNLLSNHLYAFEAYFPVCAGEASIQTTGSFISKADYEFFGLRGIISGCAMECCMRGNIKKLENYILMHGTIDSLYTSSPANSLSPLCINLCSFYLGEQFIQLYPKIGNYGFIYNSTNLKIYDMGVI